MVTDIEKHKNFKLKKLDKINFNVSVLLDATCENLEIQN